MGEVTYIIIFKGYIETIHTSHVKVKVTINDMRLGKTERLWGDSHKN